ncbi:zinc ribbon domain-containing protein [Amycolatopsis sp. NBC_01286]|uniref:zinc ribbon domain-containing protein n=1 Tax=Amycolatopsis sp. NBC_01286 TaxID=2903560 RepID=UPI002E149136|nr:zinc ribbon domain-containing protein [Amycolatopsis sp. NBC_01286]
MVTAVVAVVGLVITVSVQGQGRSSNASSSSGYSAADVGGLGAGSGGYQPSYPTASDSPTTTSSALPTSSADAVDQLRQYADADLPAVRSALEDHWVAQLSSKKVGMEADGIVYDAPAILQDHLRLRTSFASVRLIWTGDWSSFKYPDFWVTVQDQSFGTADDANAWCDGQGLPKDDCYAKRLRSSGGYEGNTKVR